MPRLLLVLFLIWPASVLAEPLRVVAVNSVLANFAATLGGEAVTVDMPVPEGRDPMHWRPAIAEIGQIQSADLILLNGAGYAGWTAKTSLPRARSVVTTKGFEDRFITTEETVTHSHGAEGEHSHTATSAITWLDFALAAEQARAIAAALDQRLETPVDTSTLVDGLMALDAQAREIGAGMDVPLIAAHPYYAYFGRAYGIEVINLDWDPGVPPTAAQIARLEDVLMKHPGAVFLWHRAPVEEGRIALAALNVQAIVFDIGANDEKPFLDRMTGNLDALAAALGSG